MDDKWFKHQQKLANMTAEDIAKLVGKDRSVVSRIYTGRQKMNLEWAKAFAKAFNQPVAEILERAGAMDQTDAQEMRPGFADSDAAAWVAGPGLAEAAKVRSIAAILGADRPGIDVWRVKSGAMALDGLLEGDFMLVDSHQADRVSAGDMVIAQIYNRSGRATTVLRRLEPPVLVAASRDRAENRVHVVDGDNVQIRGKIVASWRVA